MSFEKLETNGFCVGGRHRSATTKTSCDMTSKRFKVLIGYCSICYRKKLRTVRDKTIQAGDLGDFFKNVVKREPYVSKKMAENILNNPGRALDLTAKIATAAVSKNSKQSLSTLSKLITFYNTGKGFYFGKCV